MRGLITVLLSLSTAVFPLPGNADEGATDADGCHGEPSLHCHHPEPEEEEEDDSGLAVLFDVLFSDTKTGLVTLGVLLLAGGIAFALSGAEDTSADTDLGEFDENSLDDLPHLYVDWRPDEGSGFLGVQLSF